MMMGDVLACFVPSRTSGHPSLLIRKPWPPWTHDVLKWLRGLKDAFPFLTETLYPHYTNTAPAHYCPARRSHNAVCS
jgi:hypothetical protein